MLGFKNFECAAVTIVNVEMLHRIRKGQFTLKKIACQRPEAVHRIHGVDLFALMSALGWLVGQPGFAPRGDHLFHVITSALDSPAASARTADVMRTDVRLESENGRCRHDDPNDGSGSVRDIRNSQSRAAALGAAQVNTRPVFESMFTAK
jgi:hypothetical protein